MNIKNIQIHIFLRKNEGKQGILSAALPDLSAALPGLSAALPGPSFVHATSLLLNNLAIAVAKLNQKMQNIRIYREWCSEPGPPSQVVQKERMACELVVPFTE